MLLVRAWRSGTPAARDTAYPRPKPPACSAQMAPSSLPRPAPAHVTPYHTLPYPGVRHAWHNLPDTAAPSVEACEPPPRPLQWAWRALSRTRPHAQPKCPWPDPRVGPGAAPVARWSGCTADSPTLCPACTPKLGKQGTGQPALDAWAGAPRTGRAPRAPRARGRHGRRVAREDRRADAHRARDCEQRRERRRAAHRARERAVQPRARRHRQQHDLPRRTVAIRSQRRTGLVGRAVAAQACTAVQALLCGRRPRRRQRRPLTAKRRPREAAQSAASTRRACHQASKHAS